MRCNSQPLKNEGVTENNYKISIIQALATLSKKEYNFDNIAEVKNSI